MDDAEGFEGELAGALRPGNGGRIGVEITAEGTAPFAEGAGLALAAALFDVDGFGFCEVGAAADDHGAIGIFLHDLPADVFFDAIHFPGRKEFAVGELREVVLVAADAGELLDMAVPGGEVVVADGPGNGEPVAGGAFEFKGAPALGLAGPKEGFAADLVAADPIERFLLYVGVRLIFYEEVLGGFAIGITAIDDGAFGVVFFGHIAAVEEVPGILCCGGVVFEVFDGAAAFEQESGEAVFAELFCGPAAADAGADDDGVVLIHMALVEGGS